MTEKPGAMERLRGLVHHFPDIDPGTVDREVRIVEACAALAEEMAGLEESAAINPTTREKRRPIRCGRAAVLRDYVAKMCEVLRG